MHYDERELKMPLDVILTLEEGLRIQLLINKKIRDKETYLRKKGGKLPSHLRDIHNDQVKRLKEIQTKIDISIDNFNTKHIVEARE